MRRQIDQTNTLAHADRNRIEASIEHTPRCVALLPHVQIEGDRFAWHLWGGWLMWTATITWWRVR